MPIDGCREGDPFTNFSGLLGVDPAKITFAAERNAGYVRAERSHGRENLRPKQRQG